MKIESAFSPMTELEDLRDRTFQWSYRSGFPVEIEILEEDRNAGRLWRTSNNQPDLFAQFANVSWHVRATKEITALNYHIGFADGPILGEGRSHFLHPFEIILDGHRIYRLGKDTYTQSRWVRNNGEDAMVFHRPDEHDDAPKSGRIWVTPEANLLDSPPLLVLGLAMAVEGHLFRHLGSSRP